MTETDTPRVWVVEDAQAILMVAATPEAAAAEIKRMYTDNYNVEWEPLTTSDWGWKLVGFFAKIGEERAFEMNPYNLIGEVAAARER